MNCSLNKTSSNHPYSAKLVCCPMTVALKKESHTTRTRDIKVCVELPPTSEKRNMSGKNREKLFLVTLHIHCDLT